MGRRGRGAVFTQWEWMGASVGSHPQQRAAQRLPGTAGATKSLTVDLAVLMEGQVCCCASVVPVPVPAAAVEAMPAPGPVQRQPQLAQMLLSHGCPLPPLRRPKRCRSTCWAPSAWTTWTSRPPHVRYAARAADAVAPPPCAGRGCNGASASADAPAAAGAGRSPDTDRLVPPPALPLQTWTSPVAAS